VFGRLENTIGPPLVLSELAAVCRRTGRTRKALECRERAERILAGLELTCLLRPCRRVLPHRTREHGLGRIVNSGVIPAATTALL
jgi:hypothetical protein